MPANMQVTPTHPLASEIRRLAATALRANRDGNFATLIAAAMELDRLHARDALACELNTGRADLLDRLNEENADLLAVVERLERRGDLPKGV